jgi:hypothetical protein
VYGGMPPLGESEQIVSDYLLLYLIAALRTRVEGACRSQPSVMCWDDLSGLIVWMSFRFADHPNRWWRGRGDSRVPER